MFKTILAAVVTGLSLFALGGCGSQTPPEHSLNAPPTPAPEDPRGTAGLDAREQDLAQREAELKLKEREDELARREAEFAEQQRSTSSSQTKSPTSRSAAATTTRPADRPRTAAVTPTRLTIPTGTQLTMQLSSDLSSKTAVSGDTFDSRLYEDVMVDGKVALPAGSRVSGTVTNVISGSSKIGGVPTLGLRFDNLVLPDGQKVAINGEIIQEGKSDTGRDTAKILGGAAAGAVIGHQVKKDDKGKILGGIVGGAIGAIAAKKTGTEVELASDSTLTVALAAPIEVTVK